MVGQIERLEEQLQVHPILERKQFAEAGVQLEERRTTQTVIAGDAAAVGGQASTNRRRTHRGGGGVVAWSAVEENGEFRCTGVSVAEIVRAFPRCVGSRGSRLHDGSKADSPRQVEDAADHKPAALVVGSGTKIVRRKPIAQIGGRVAEAGG